MGSLSIAKFSDICNVKTFHFAASTSDVLSTIPEGEGNSTFHQFSIVSALGVESSASLEGRWMLSILATLKMDHMNLVEILAGCTSAFLSNLFMTFNDGFGEAAEYIVVMPGLWALT
jgi:hypothetical protein